MAGRRNLRQGGFSLVEVMVVVAITLVLVGIAVPAMQTRDNASAEVRRFVADAARARAWSRTSWRDAWVDVDTQNDRWRLIDDEGEILDSYSADANGWRALTEGVRFEATGQASDFAFTPDGRGAADASVRIVAGDASWTVTLSALTGAVSANSN